MTVTVTGLATMHNADIDNNYNPALPIGSFLA